MVRIQIRKIEFHSASNIEQSWRGADSYTIPAGTPAAIVTFEVIDFDRSTDVTEIIIGSVSSFDELVDMAQTKAIQRLIRIGKSAEQMAERLAQRQSE